MPEETHAAEFLEALTAAKEKLKEEEKKTKKEKAKKEIKKKPRGLRKAPSKEKEVREKLSEISVEKEAAKIPAKPAKPLPPKFVPPIYKRPLPPLPSAPKYAEEWPLRPPTAPARPPEEEAAAPPVTEAPIPAAPEVAPAKPLLDLGKLNPLITDPATTTIQCDGANIPIKLIRAGKIEETPTALSEEEIKSIIKAFSDASGETITEPMFKATAAGYTISAAISAFAGSKFVITRS